MSPERATLADLPRLLELDALCFARPWTEAAWRAELEPGGGRLVLLAEAGFACAPIVVDACELRRIAVRPSARGRGLGRDLLAAVIAHARAAGCERVELEVAAGNLAALALYRAAGFVEVGRRAGYYKAPPDDAALLTLALEPTPNSL